jgi:hypothetical protein
MANEITSSVLASALNNKMIDGAFDIARSNIQGILQTAQMGSEKAPFEGYKMSWTEMQVSANGSLMTAAALAAATTLTVADGARFRAGMTASSKGSDEVVLITVVTGNDLTVVRGFGGTTAADIASGDALVVDTVGREENSTAVNDGIFQPDVVENYFQTMDTSIEMSRRSLATLQYGDTNDLAFQLNERIKQMAIQMNRGLVRGRKAVGTVGGKSISYSGGMKYFLDQAGRINTDNAAGALTLDQINVLNAEMVSRGGSANTVAVGINKARELNALVSANYSGNRLADWSADQGAVVRLPTDLPLVGGVNTIVVDTNLNDDELFIYDSSKLIIRPMASGNASDSGQWRTLDATQAGQDGEKVRILGDFAFEIRDSITHMARLGNIV